MLHTQMQQGVAISGRHGRTAASPIGACSRQALRGIACRAQQVRGTPTTPVVQQSKKKSVDPEDEELDTKALTKYITAVPVQVTAMTGALWGLTQATNALTTAGTLPGGLEGADAAKGLVTLFFLTMSLGSRIFSILPAKRPSLNSEGKDQAAGLRPWWTPPPIAFPIGWSIIALLRTTSSVMVWEASGRNALVVPLVIMMLQLSCGDCWNFIRNVENRLGVAAAGMILNCSLFYLTIYSYYQVDETAGLVLLPSAPWITFAATIVWGIWDLAGRPPLYPTKGESKLAL